ncbi:hypothetical protein D3C81_1739300 [compost metagenome]
MFGQVRLQLVDGGVQALQRTVLPDQGQGGFLPDARAAGNIVAVIPQERLHIYPLSRENPVIRLEMSAGIDRFALLAGDDLGGGVA